MCGCWRQIGKNTAFGLRILEVWASALFLTVPLERPLNRYLARSLLLPASMLQQLTEHRASQAEALLKLGVRTELCFANSEGAPILRRNLVRRHFKPVLKAAKLPATFSLYALRHTCATLLLQAGTHPKVVSERLGHSSTTLTMDVYSHVVPGMQAEAAAQLERMLYG